MGIGTSAARKLAALRKTHGGPAKVRTRCPKCSTWCEGARLAREHCRGKRK